MRVAPAELVAALAPVLRVSPLAVEAQSAGKVPRIGVLSVIPISSLFARQCPEAPRVDGAVAAG